ncbi:MAG: pseudouridine synthase, partial [Acidimicrobiia bacterium]|nr:pseudouridine synthase [Acidimicrobiia bacterium]MDX2467923.1 pseudouridine synthase [Acidimicrobiia bacterium]
MNSHGVVEVPEDLDGVRLDRVVAVLAEVSRAVSRKMIDEGGIEVAGSAATMATVPHTGDTIRFRAPEPAAPLVAEKIEFGVAYKSDEIIVINKPAGLVVHPGAGNVSGTLVNGLIYRFPDLA